MNIYKSWLKTYAVACFFVSMLFFSCNNGSGNQASEGIEEDSTMMVEESSSQTEKVYYQVPAPDEMISFIKQGGFDYDGTFLNPADRADQHVDQKAQALNLGIYTADLTYMATYGQFQESIRYFNVVMKLADKLGVSSAFDEALVSRVKNNLTNADSLETISADSYYSIVDNLERSQRGHTLAMIAAGGWLESMYVVVNLMKKYDAESPFTQRIADQKLVFKNLWLYLEKYQDEPTVQTTLQDFNKLKSIFDSFEQTSYSTSLKKSGSQMVLGGSGKIIMTAEQFDQLKNEVISLRNSIASVNS